MVTQKNLVQKEEQGTELKKLYVQRKAFTYEDKKTKQKREAFEYFIAANIRDRKFVIKVGPQKKDVAAYEVLDMLFEDLDKLELVSESYEYEKNGQKVSGINYFVVSKDNDGFEDRLQVFPLKPSDNAVLDMLYKRVQAYNKKILEAQKQLEIQDTSNVDEKIA